MNDLPLATSDDRGFAPFGPDHLVVLVVVAVASFLFCYRARRAPHSKALRAAEITLAVLLFAHWPLNVIIGIQREMHTGWEQALPMYLCSWAAIATGIALISRHWLAVELCWFWGLGGTLQGLITPALTYSFPDPFWFTFFLLHGGIVIASIHCVLGRKQFPPRASLWRAILAMEVYFFTALGVNALLGTNYGFLATKPSQPSLLDLFGEWPGYLIGIQVAGVIAMVLLWLPFQFRRKEA